MVLGACLAARDMLVELGHDQDSARVVLVTDDEGLLEAAKPVFFHVVVAISTAAYARAWAA